MNEDGGRWRKIKEDDGRWRKMKKDRMRKGGRRR
jgi:hypothetical protein